MTITQRPGGNKWSYPGGSYTIHKVVLHHLKEDYNMLKKYTVLLLLVKWSKGVRFTILSEMTKISDKIYETMALKTLDISQ